MDGIELEFTRNELIYLSDCLSFHIVMPDGNLVHPKLLMKIGSGILETESGEIASKIQITEDEAWTIREYAKSPVKMGAENVGMGLMIKIYEALRILVTSREYDFDFSSKEQPEQYNKEKLKKWKGGD